LSDNLHEDAARLARRFHEARVLLEPSVAGWDDIVIREQERLIAVFDHLIRTEVVFAGPSLYADPGL
jgi:hypothetical protein